MVNREYLKSKIDMLPEETVLRIDEIINSGKTTHMISAYNKKTRRVIRQAHEKPHKAKSFKNAEDLYKDLGI